MKRFTSILCLAVTSTVMAISATNAMAVDGGKMCLPVGSGDRGLTTGVRFSGSYYARGRLSGLRVVQLVDGNRQPNNRPSFSLKLATRSGAVLYSGPLWMGQVIPMSDASNLVWTGYTTSPYGNHMNGICVVSIYQ